MPHNNILTLDDGHECLCVSHLGKITGKRTIIKWQSKLSHKCYGTYVTEWLSGEIYWASPPPPQKKTQLKM